MAWYMRMIKPPAMQIMAMRTPSAGLTLRAGIGLRRVRSIFSSQGHSWYWLNAEAPAASRKIPAVTHALSRVASPVFSTIVAKAVKVTARVTGNRIRKKISLKPIVCKPDSL